MENKRFTVAVILCVLISVLINSVVEPDQWTTYPLSFQNVSTITCYKCPPGTHKVTDCDTDFGYAKCRNCSSGYFSSTYNVAIACGKCKGHCYIHNQIVVGKCTSTSDLKCECKPGYYLDVVPGGHPDRDGHCLSHKPCPSGQGVESVGTPFKDTQCVVCPKGTFSRESLTEPCLECTKCEDLGLQEVSACTRGNNTVCKNHTAGNPKKEGLQWWGILLCVLAAVVVPSAIAWLILAALVYYRRISVPETLHCILFFGFKQAPDWTDSSASSVRGTSSLSRGSSHDFDNMSNGHMEIARKEEVLPQKGPPLPGPQVSLVDSPRLKAKLHRSGSSPQSPSEELPLFSISGSGQASFDGGGNLPVGNHNQTVAYQSSVTEQLLNDPKNIKVTEELLRNLSGDLTIIGWEFFFRELFVKGCDNLIEEVKMNHQGVKEQIYQLLQRWYRRTTPQATLDNILSALRAIKQNELADSYTAKYCRKPSQSTLV